MREINYYKTASGNCPVQKFIDSLSPKQKKKTFYVFGRVEEEERVPINLFEPLINNIWKINVSLDRNEFRFLGFREENNSLILTNGFAKKTQKVPLQEIELAKKRRQDYLKRKESK